MPLYFYGFMLNTEQKPQKKIWLYNVIEAEMENATSALRVSFNWLCDTVNCRNGALFLYEFNENDRQCIIFTNGNVKCMPLNNENSALYHMAEKARNEKTTVTEDGILSFCLKSKDADAFGGISFYCTEPSDSKDFYNALSSFSETVYNELMIGFLESDAEEVLRGENLYMNYSSDGSQPNTLDDVSFSIRRGQFTVIMGRSGCGKSTLLNIIGGILTPTSGKLLYCGQDITTFNNKQKTMYRRDDIGFVFQNYNLITDLTALENVNVAAALAKNKESSEDLLTQVGLKDRMTSSPSKMSGGEQQRVSIARALVKQPKILLCDEPTGALDTDNAKNIMKLLQNITHERNICVIMVTHNPEFIPLSDHYIEMKNGQIIQDIYQPFPFNAEDKL